MGDEYKRQYNINTLTIDIETIPSGNKLSVEEMKAEAPKNYKNEDTILKWCEENIDLEFRKRSLNSLKGRLLCISVKWDDKPSHIIKYNEDEKVMIEEFAGILKKLERHIQSTAFLGHNVKSFDIRWLLQRAFKYDNKDLIRFLPSSKFDKRIVDTNDLFNQGVYGAYVKLKDMCEFLGVPTPKDDIDGSEVYDVYLQGDLERIYTYCGKDTDATYACWRKMQVE